MATIKAGSAGRTDISSRSGSIDRRDNAEFKSVVIDKKGLDKYNFIDQKSFTDLNKERKSFLDDYGMYAGGVKVFDDKLYDNFEADEGIYNVEIRLNNGKKFTDKIIVREDPLKSN